MKTVVLTLWPFLACLSGALLASGQNGSLLNGVDSAMSSSRLNELPSQRKIQVMDSVPNLEADSLANALRKQIAQLNETIRRAGKAADSLTTNTLRQLNSKLESLLGRGSGILNSARTSIPSITIPNPGGLPNPIGQPGLLNLENSFQIPGLPNLNPIPLNTGYSMPKYLLPNSGTLENSVPQINNLNLLNTSTNDLVNGNQLSQELQKLQSLPSKKISGASQDLQKVKAGDFREMDALPKEAENRLTNLSEFKELKTNETKVLAEKNAFEKYRESVSRITAGKINDEDKSLAKQALVDHFAGQEQKIQAGIAQLNKLKKKYHTIPDSRYLPKHAPNEMKGKPFRERFIPGVNFQFFRNAYPVIELAPFALYRASGRIRTGVGYTYRIMIDDKHMKPVHDQRAYGFRLMTDYALISGMYLRAEGELINFAPYDPRIQTLPDPGEPRKWIPGFSLGLLKSYSIGSRLTGNFQTLYNFAWHRNGLYHNRLTLRFGFDINLVKTRSQFSPAFALEDLRPPVRIQGQSIYHYTGKKKLSDVMMYNLRDGRDTVSVTKSIASRKEPVRMVVSSNGVYRFRYNASEGWDEILTREGALLATSRSFYDLTLPNRKSYSLIRISDTEWKYISEGDEVLHGKLILFKGAREIQMRWTGEAGIVDESVWMIAQVYGVNLVHLAGHLPALFKIFKPRQKIVSPVAPGVSIK
jgi:hypothetical protein